MGTTLGGPLTAWLGAQHTLLIPAGATIATGLAAAAVIFVQRQERVPKVRRDTVNDRSRS